MPLAFLAACAPMPAADHMLQPAPILCQGGEVGYWSVFKRPGGVSLALTSRLDDADTVICLVPVDRGILVEQPWKNI